MGISCIDMDIATVMLLPLIGNIWLDLLIAVNQMLVRLAEYLGESEKRVNDEQVMPVNRKYM